MLVWELLLEQLYTTQQHQRLKFGMEIDGLRLENHLFKQLVEQ
jgi:hypothetical protein